MQQKKSIPKQGDGLKQKVYNLCQFIQHSDKAVKLNILIQKSRQLGLPISPRFSQQRYIYNISLAAINAIIDNADGFELAAIFLKDVCTGKSYWDILHFLYQFKDQIQLTLATYDEVLQRIQMYNIEKCHNLNTSYQCHCKTRDPNMNFQGKPRIKNKQDIHTRIKKYLTESNNGQQGASVAREGKQIIIDIPPNANSNFNQIIIGSLSLVDSSSDVTLIQMNNCINVDAEIIDLCHFPEENQDINNRAFLNKQRPEEDSDVEIYVLDDEKQMNMEGKLNMQIQENKRDQNEINIIESQNMIEIKENKSDNKWLLSQKRNVKDLQKWQLDILNLINVDLSSQMQQPSFSDSDSVIQYQKQPEVPSSSLMDQKEDIHQVRQSNNGQKFAVQNFENGYIEQVQQNFCHFAFKDFVLKQLNIDCKPQQKMSTQKQQSLYKQLGKFNGCQQVQQCQIQRCQICLQLYHPQCQFGQVLLCNKCIVKQNSLKYRVISQLFAGYVQQGCYLTTINFNCPNVLIAKQQYSDSYIVQMRLQVLGNKQQQMLDEQQQTQLCQNRPILQKRKSKKYGYAQNGSQQQQQLANTSKKRKKSKNYKFGKMVFYLNYQPMHINYIQCSSQIYSIKLPLKYLQQKNTIIIEQVSLDKMYLVNSNKNLVQNWKNNRKILFVGIYKVVPRSKRKQLLNNSCIKMPENSLKLFYQSILKKNKQNKMKISTLSFLTNKQMTCPLRSFNCNHPQCFDYSQISFMLNKQKLGQNLLLGRKQNRLKNTVNGMISSEYLVANSSFGIRHQAQTIMGQNQNIQNLKKTYKNLINLQKKIPKKHRNKIYCPKCKYQINGVYIDTIIQNFIDSESKKQKLRQCHQFYYQSKNDYQKNQHAQAQIAVVRHKYNQIGDRRPQIQSNEFIYQNVKPTIQFQKELSSMSDDFDEYFPIGLLGLKQRKITKLNDQEECISISQEPQKIALLDQQIGLVGFRQTSDLKHKRFDGNRAQEIIEVESSVQVIMCQQMNQNPNQFARLNSRYWQRTMT